MPGLSTRGTAASWTKNHSLSKSSVLQSHTPLHKSTSQHPKLADHHHPLHHTSSKKLFKKIQLPKTLSTTTRSAIWQPWTSASDKRGRCNFCPKGVSRWKCWKCNVFLCLNAKQECFAAYHQNCPMTNNKRRQNSRNRCCTPYQNHCSCTTGWKPFVLLHDHQKAFVLLPLMRKENSIHFLKKSSVYLTCSTSLAS